MFGSSPRPIVGAVVQVPGFFGVKKDERDKKGSGYEGSV